MSIKTWFSGLWDKITEWFNGSGGHVARQGLAAVLEQVGNVGLSMLLDVAQSKVKALNVQPLSNDVKREQALDYLKGYAVQAGLQVGENVLRYTLETAVAAVKGDAKH